MSISFNNIPSTQRTPGSYVEVDNSRALQGLFPNPHKALIIGQKLKPAEGPTKPSETLIAITSDNLADGYFGAGSPLARMCNMFKSINPNTELYAIAISDTGYTAKASGTLQTSIAISANGFSCGGAGTFYMMINGTAVNVTMVSTWSTTDINSAIVAKVNSMSQLPVIASTNAASAINFIAVVSGLNGNYIDVRHNYHNYQSYPAAFSGDSVKWTSMANGAGAPDLGSAWTIIENEQFHYIVQPYTDSDNLTEIEDELEDRFGPLEDKQGHGFTAYPGAQASCASLGNGRNSPHNTIIGVNSSPHAPEEWAAALGAQAAFYLNQDPARPLQTLPLTGILPPLIDNRFTRAERELLLYDGIATWYVDNGGRVLIERCITTYQTNAFGIVDPSYLDVNTLATLGEIRYQFNARMTTRFLSARYKLADDGFPVQPGSYVVTPSVIKQEIIALFVLLQDDGLIENLDDFKNNLVVERDTSDRNRVNVLLPADVVNQFRIVAGLLQFIL